jgi:hypothetical protein
MSSLLQRWFRNGELGFPTMVNYQRVLINMVLILRIRDGEFSFRNFSQPEERKMDISGLMMGLREIVLNAISLGFGFFGNFCLLLNFTKRVRYIIALPATIIAWYFATGIVFSSKHYSGLKQLLT